MMQIEAIQRQFGKVVRRWRKHQRLSQEELATGAGLHRTYISDVERGFRNPSLQSIAKIAAALDISLATLFDYSAEGVDGELDGSSRAEPEVSAPVNA